jgi:hypothetical protein
MQFIRIGNTRADCKQAEIKLRQGGSWISHIPSRQNFRRVCTSILSGLRWHRQSWVPGPFQSIEVLHLLRWHMHSHILPRHHSHFHSLASLLATMALNCVPTAALQRARQLGASSPNPKPPPDSPAFSPRPDPNFLASSPAFITFPTDCQINSNNVKYNVR